MKENLMNLIQYNTNRWFDFPFDRFFDEFVTRRAPVNSSAGTYQPRVDIVEEKDAVVVSAEIPGVEKDKLSVELEDGVLTLSAEKTVENREEKNDLYRSERTYGTYKRTFKVPASVDADKISAEYVNGVLKVTLPKHPEAAPRQIEITVENGGAKQIETK